MDLLLMAVWVAVAVFIVVLPSMPLINFLARQRPAAPFQIAALVGGTIPAVGAGFAVEGANLGYGIGALIAAGVGAVGAHLGAAIAACCVGPQEPRARAQRGAGYGLLAGAILTVLLVFAQRLGQFWFQDYSSRVLGVGFGIIALPAAVGAIIGRSRTEGRTPGRT